VLEILLVDDDELVRQTMSMLLDREGFQVSVAAGGREAIAKARQQLFDLVICDVRMGDMNGLETVAALRESLPEAHMILITGYADEETPVEALRLRVDDYLRKPFDLDQFLSRIRALRKRKRPPSGRQVLMSFTEELRARSEWAEHVTQVERSAVAAAERLGVPPDEVQALRVAARLHDLVSGTPASPDEALDLVARLLVSLGGPSEWKAQQILNAAVAVAHGDEPAVIDASVLEEVRRASGSVRLEVVTEPLRLDTLGDTRISVGGRACVFESARARWLLLYLCSRRGQLVTQERLRDLFWPDSDADKAQRALVSTVHRVRKALDLPDVLLREERGYRFNTALGAWWDLDQMERCWREGQSSARAGRMAEAVRSFLVGAALYRGEFARDCSDEWVLGVREGALRVALSCLESASELSEDPSEAEGAARRALELDPVSETAAANLVRVLARMDRRDEAVKFYHQFTRLLQRELSLPPGPELARAYLEITS
jgi:two-component SAPR family response regulator